jgi:hypothetical protein
MATRTPVGVFGTGQRGIGSVGWALLGAAAGAAGTTALDAVTYLDMAARGRGPSSTPEQTVETLAGKAHLSIPGAGETRENRLQGLGALSGITAGIGVGVLAGLARAAGFRPPGWLGGLAAGLAAMIGANGPMTVLGITDPRTWSTIDWVSDVVPHLAYGFATHSTLAALDRA